MSVWLLAAVAAVYVYVAADYAMAGKYGMCVAFGAYSLSNLGFIIDKIR